MNDLKRVYGELEPEDKKALKKAVKLEETLQLNFVTKAINEKVARTLKKHGVK